MRKIAVLVLSIIVLAGAFALLQPVYQFYAHKGVVPMPFWGYLDIPEPSPVVNQVLDHAFENAAAEAILALQKHSQQINSPGISAAVAIDGELVWQGTSGWADIAKRRPLTPETRFRIGSTSKALTSTLLARMVQEGKLDLDAAIKQYQLGTLNPRWQNITPRQLASHMTGIPHYGQNSEWLGLYQSMALNTRYANVKDATALFDQSELLFQPGEKFSYSSLGYVLLSAVMQEAAGMPYQELMQTYVLGPLGMNHTAPEPEISSSSADSDQLASFYWRADESKPVIRKWRDVDLSHRLAGGGFISTSTDLVKLGLGFLRDDFVLPSVRQQFWTPQTLNNGEVNEQHYAIGWRVRDYDVGEPVGVLFNANHGGVSRGAQSWLMVIPEYNMAVAVNINTKTEQFWDFGKVSKELVRIFLIERQKQESGM